ncbi:TraV family lipoprotein [Desulfurobacterium sp.]
MRKMLVLFSIPVVLASCGASQRQSALKIVPTEKRFVSKKVDIVPELKTKPIYVPPEVVRVLIYPYEDESGILHQGEFLYFTVRPGYWTIATKAEVYKADKYVNVVHTQKGLDSEDNDKAQVPELKKIPEDNLTPQEKKKLEVIQSYIKTEK